MTQDLDLATRPATVTVGGSYSNGRRLVLRSWRERRRPLKGRSAKATRPIAIPEKLVALLQAHLDEFVRPKADALEFTTRAGARSTGRGSASTSIADCHGGLSTGAPPRRIRPSAVLVSRTVSCYYSFLKYTLGVVVGP
jgi:hypothetical protein